jgi:hypothetical protein
MGERVSLANAFERVERHKQACFSLVGLIPENAFKRVHLTNVFTLEVV